MGALASCANETDDFVNQNDVSELKAVEAEEYLNITYKGKTYFGVPTTYDENGDSLRRSLCMTTGIIKTDNVQRH